jgi:hypothetical protein
MRILLIEPFIHVAPVFTVELFWVMKLVVHVYQSGYTI